MISVLSTTIDFFGLLLDKCSLKISTKCYIQLSPFDTFFNT